MLIAQKHEVLYPLPVPYEPIITANVRFQNRNKVPRWVGQMHVELVLPRTLIVLYLADLRQTDSGLQHDLVEEERVEFDTVLVTTFVCMQ
jgi:hypothetical protein